MKYLPILFIFLACSPTPDPYSHIRELLNERVLSEYEIISVTNDTVTLRTEHLNGMENRIGGARRLNSRVMQLELAIESVRGLLSFMPERKSQVDSLAKVKEGDVDKLNDIMMQIDSMKSATVPDGVSRTETFVEINTGGILKAYAIGYAADGHLLYVTEH